MYKILSLDGGGSWAILQLLTLKEKYGNVKGHEVLKDFDLVVANSGGSIVLAALCENWTLKKSLSLFDNKDIREQIFSKNRFKDRYFPTDYLRLFAGFGPKYSTPKKGEAFKTLLKEVNKRQMDELPEFIGKPSLKIVVSTYDALNNRAKFFKSYGTPGREFDSVRLTQAIHGSSNAPVQYFDFPARFKAKETEVFYELWDGALGGFNNPVTAGVIEAFKLGTPLSDIAIVSIGTGNKLMSQDDKERFFQVEHISIKERRKKLRFWRFKYQMQFFSKTILNQAKTILYQPPDWANYVAYMFLADKANDDLGNRFIRLSPMVHIDKETDPETKALLQKLYGMDMDLSNESDIDVLKQCFTFWRDDKIQNQPIAFKVTRDNELLCLKGDQYYSEALKKWEELG